jgi:hypothetical protein
MQTYLDTSTGGCQGGDSPLVGQIRYRLGLCSTTWLYLLRTYADGSQDKIVTENHCFNRSCPICTKARITRAKEMLIPYFSSMRRVSHVTLTFGGHVEAREDLKAEMNRKFNNLKRQLMRLRKYKGVALYEFKIEADGKYHAHIHVAFEYAPHHLSLFTRWAHVNKAKYRVHVKYRARKSVILRYFAKRIALAGMEMPLEDYAILVHKRRLFSAFGRFSSILVACVRNSTIDTDKFHIFSVTILNCMTKSQHDTEPPPELYDLTDKS